jgi:hypothetical protein
MWPGAGVSEYKGFRDDSVTDEPEWLTLRVPVYVRPDEDGDGPDEPSLLAMLDDDYDRAKIAEEIRTQVLMADDDELLDMISREVCQPERAKRIETAAERVGMVVDELTDCLEERGNPPAPCHGQPLSAMLAAASALRSELESKP